MVSAETVNCFKTRLDRFWLNQDIIYNFRSEIHGTGSQSEIRVKPSLEYRHSNCVIESGKEAINCACFLSTSTSIYDHVGISTMYFLLTMYYFKRKL